MASVLQCASDRKLGRTGVLGVIGVGPEAALKIALQSPPVDGRANHEVIEQLANLFDVPRWAVHVITGAHSRNKVVRVQGRSRT